tara:strand:+ start:881 stop:2161 length:1281 start_codon:yes stop_codon:yes gene_type:complete
VNKLKLIILLFISLATQVVAQNTVHLCIGDDHNFGVPDNPTSLAFNWLVSDPSLATIDSGNGTHHILIDLNNKGVFKLLVEEIDANGCSGYDSILVEIHALPNPNIFASGPISFCDGDSVLIQVDSVYDAFLWNNNSTSIYIYADSISEYYVNVTDTNGCKNNSNIISIDVYPKPIADFIVDGFCINSTTMLLNNSSVISGNIVSSIWHFENGDIENGDTLLYTYNFAKDYFTQLFVTSNYGCVDSIKKFYTIFNNPIAKFEYTPFTISTLEPEMNFITKTSNYNSVFWDFGNSFSSVFANPIHEFSSAGTHDVWLTVVDSNQCIDSVMHTIIMYYDFVLYLPNTFTPNNDNVNDTFGPKGLRMKEYLSYDFTIFNRWGEKVFTSDNIIDYWDGGNSQNGKYSWVIMIEDELGKIHKKAGEIMLIR